MDRASNADTRLLYRQDHLPIFQNVVYASESAAKACPKGDMQLVEDLRTGLVYNAAFRPEEVEYGEDYQNEQALSAAFRDHLGAVAGIIECHLGRQVVIEVGCGKGFFLEELLARGFDVIGFDPTYEGSNPRVRKEYFAPGAAIRAQGLIMRHVLEHIQDPVAFLFSLAEANGGSGRIYIEVPRFEWICENRAWFDVFYEHVNYFRMSDFYRMFGEVIDSGVLFGGQYHYVVAELATLRWPKFDPDDPVAFPPAFEASIRASGPRGAPAAIWGGSSKGVTFALLKERVGQVMATAIDINPAKQGRYLPVTGLKVRSPDEALAILPKGSLIYIMNSVYSDEIRGMAGSNYKFLEIENG